MLPWERPEWVDSVHSSIVPRASTGPVALPGSLWVAKDTQRRGRVLWASGGLVKLVFSESSPDAFVILAAKDLTNIYTEIH